MRSSSAADEARPGGRSRGTAAVGAAAVGAAAIGAFAIGAMAIGRLAVRKARIGSLEIGDLTVENLDGAAATAMSAASETGAAAPMVSMANEYVAMCRQGLFEEAMGLMFSADHVRVEPKNMLDPPAEMHGLAAVRENSREFAGTTQIHGVEVDGPYVGGDGRFAVRFSIEATEASTTRKTITKLDLYTVRDGRIVRSEVYYNTPPLA